MESINSVLVDVNKFVSNFRKDVVDAGGYEEYKVVMDKFYDGLTKYILQRYNINCNVYKVSGELKHSPVIFSKYWKTKRIWICLLYFDKWIYIDPFSIEVSKLIPEIPEYYISFKMPKWYLPLYKNKSYSTNLGIFLNHKFGVIKEEDGTLVRYGIIDYLQYKVWGRISDWIHKIRYKEKA